MSTFSQDTPSQVGNSGNHFRQFIANSIPNGRYSQSLNSNYQSTPSLLSQPPQEAKKQIIDLEKFQKHITSSPSRLHLNYDISTLNNSQVNNNTYIPSTLKQSMNSAVNQSGINDSKFSNQQNTQISQKDNLLSLEQSMVGSTQNNSIVHNKSNINSRTLQLQRSFFFNGPERFENDKNHNYFGRSTINPMVDTQKYETSQDEDIKYYKIFQKNEQQYDDSKLILKTDGNYLKPPKEHIKELNEVKKNQQLLQDWKEDHQLKSKQYKLAKAAYKSGISHLDGPLAGTTQIYENEHKKFVQRENDEINRRKVRLSYIEKFVNTNPAIYFDNSVQNTQFEQKKHMFPHHIDDFQNGFLKKHKSDLAQQRNLQTFDRLFGHNLNDQKQIIGSQRSKFLMSKDLYGKTQNIISNTLNPSLKYAQ